VEGKGCDGGSNGMRKGSRVGVDWDGGKLKRIHEDRADSWRAKVGLVLLRKCAFVHEAVERCC